MNIFYLNPNPKTCAQWHNNSHCSKMIIEYAQLMSTAHRTMDGEMYYGKTKNGRKIKRWLHPNNVMETTLYKASHINHPSGIWTRESRANYEWLYTMWCELNEEFIWRGFKNGEYHETYNKLKDLLREPPKSMKQGTFTQPTPAMPDDVKNKDSLTAYRNYYIEYKQHLAKWGKREEPHWYVRAA